jgi:hypothetical protein
MRHLCLWRAQPDPRWEGERWHRREVMRIREICAAAVMSRSYASRRAAEVETLLLIFDGAPDERYNGITNAARKISARALLSSSMAEHPAVNRRVVGSSPT